MGSVSYLGSYHGVGELHGALHHGQEHGVEVLRLLLRQHLQHAVGDEGRQEQEVAPLQRLTVTLRLRERVGSGTRHRQNVRDSHRTSVKHRNFNTFGHA